MSVLKDLPIPSNAEMKKWVDIWNSLPDYVAQENALHQIFVEDDRLRLNTDERAVLVKCAVLNDFYSTNIYKVYLVAEYIIRKVANVDSRLAAGDISLVDDIAAIGGTEFKIEWREKPFVMPRIYSFATKFCSHHNECAFPIYDSYVHQVLHAYNSNESTYFTDVPTYFFPRKGDGKYPPIVKSYNNFVRAMSDFRDRFKLKTTNGFKDIDRYLWQLGKKEFPKVYGKRNLAKCVVADV